jgi:hypothetical protein
MLYAGGRRVLKTKAMLMGVEKKLPKKNLDSLFGKVLVEDSRFRLNMGKENSGVGTGQAAGPLLVPNGRDRLSDFQLQGLFRWSQKP